MLAVGLVSGEDVPDRGEHGWSVRSRRGVGWGRGGLRVCGSGVGRRIRWCVRRDIAELADHLVAQQVSLVVMEATGDYWKPFYYGLEERLCYRTLRLTTNGH